MCKEESKDTRTESHHCYFLCSEEPGVSSPFLFWEGERYSVEPLGEICCVYLYGLETYFGFEIFLALVCLKILGVGEEIQHLTMDRLGRRMKIKVV